MELYDIMRTTFTAREFRDDPIPDSVLFKILDNARFAPSGGNRQGWRVIIVRDRQTKERIASLAEPAAKRYAAQKQAGENPWNSVDPTSIDAETMDQTPAPSHMRKIYLNAALILVVCVDLKVVASIDQDLDRVGLVSGASIYPFVWNILLAAHHEGCGGAITTMPIAEEPGLQALLGIPKHFAVSAVIPMGRPVKTLTKLERKPVSSFAVLEQWEGTPLTEVDLDG